MPGGAVTSTDKVKLRASDFCRAPTPSTWRVDTDRSATTLVLKGEEDIRRLGGRALLVTDSQGLQFRVADVAALDRHSKRLLGRFL